MHKENRDTQCPEQRELEETQVRVSEVPPEVRANDQQHRDCPHYIEIRFVFADLYSAIHLNRFWIREEWKNFCR